MFGHMTVLADQERLELFSLLRRPRQLFKGATTWIDDQGFIWTGTRVGSLSIGLSWLGPGWVFDSLAQREREDEYASKLRAMERCLLEYESNCGAAYWAEWRLGRWLADYGGRLHAHAERLLWGIHTAVWEVKSSELCLSDQWLGDLLWGTAVRPRHWRGELMTALRGLSLFHVARWTGEAAPAFGPGTALLNHVGDLRSEDDDQCDGYCPDHLVRRHHHVLVEVGPEFLGVLEQLGQLDPETGLRAYDFPRDGKGPSLRKVGKTGRLVSVFLPAKLGEPALCAKLTADQHRLMQAMLRETTRAKRKNPKKEPSLPEVFSGSSVCSFHGKKYLSCDLLDPAVQYVGFNGNGKRKGLGYRLATEGGWLAKAGYNIDRVDAFLNDLAAVAELLGLVVVGVDRMNHFIRLDAIRTLGATPAGRLARERLHVRGYTPADYLDRWSDTFQGTVAKTLHLPPLAENMGGLLATMKRKNISQRRLAKGIKTDHSFLSKLIKGKDNKRWPKGLLKKAQRWLDLKQAKSLSI